MPDFSYAHEQLKSLPIFPHLSEICAAVKSSPSRFLILTAETAAGKSTAVPIALLEQFKGRILMLEPRRLAASAIASRLSDLLGEKCGQTVGYRLHLDSKISRATRLEVITEAILTRRLQADPLLEDVNVIVLDEFHERSIHSDLALAFLKETMQLRDDLFVIVMSATINYRSLSEYLGSKAHPAPVLQIPGRMFPVEIKYQPNVSMVQAIYAELLASARSANTILCFLPGIYEIRKTKSELENLLTNVSINYEILILHSSVSLSEQRKVLSPQKDDSSIRVILSSAIAETSLTVPGVSVVIDSGLCRVNKMNIALGMEHLVTERESLFSAEQRAGRAGRISAGTCIRLWDKNEPRIEQLPPEILRADITQLVLECAEWGATEIKKLDWLTPPSESAWSAAQFLLENLDCLASSKITEKGRAVLKLGLHPRLACVALAGGAEKVLPFSEYAESNPEKQKNFINDLKRRLKECHAEHTAPNNAPATEIPVLAGFPDRLARILPNTEPNADKAEYQFPSGRTAWLSQKPFPKWLVAPEVDAGERTGTIFSYEALSEEQATTFLEKHAKTKIRTEFLEQTNGSILNNLSLQKKEVTAYGALILKTKKLPIEQTDFANVVCDFVCKKGLKILPIDSKTEDFLLRVEFFCSYDAENSHSLKEKYTSLEKQPSVWLLPFINSQKILTQDVYSALYWYLDGQEVDSKAPSQILLPNGRKRKLKYEKRADGTILPTLEIIIQQIFGCFETPTILGKPVLIKLLSPASRPLQITDDLEHFWNGAWPEICKEMKGRYPKHNWDYRLSENTNE